MRSKYKSLQQFYALTFFLIGGQLMFQCRATSQIDTTLKEFFPLKIGNLWQYRNEMGSLSRQEVIGDTVIDGRKYFLLIHSLYASSGGIVRVDSLMQIQQYAPWGGDTCGGLAQEMCFFRLGEAINSSWGICDNVYGTLRYPWYMKVAGMYNAMIFGQSREVMAFSPGAYCYDVGDTVWYFPYWEFAKGIGILYEARFEGEYMYLTGAIIDGVTYGTIVADADAQEYAPLAFSLAQNYPNPFNPVTTITYSLPKASHVRLKVYNVLGERIVSLVDEFRQPGTWSAEFDGSKLPSGVYVYRLTSGEFVAMQKMMLVK